MAVIIREKRKMAGKEYLVDVYRAQPGKLLTSEDKKKAEELDRFLLKTMRQIEEEMNSLGLLSLKNRKGKVMKLWFEVGRRLSFIEDTGIVAIEDRNFVWRALYDHAGNLAPGPLTKRAQRDPTTSHFSYCYMLSGFPWDFVESAGDWTSWSEFFDRKEMKTDPRIIEWLAGSTKDRTVKSRQNWLRPLTKEIHRRYNNVDTRIRYESREELYKELNRILAEVHEEE